MIMTRLQCMSLIFIVDNIWMLRACAMSNVRKYLSMESERRSDNIKYVICLGFEKLAYFRTQLESDV